MSPDVPYSPNQNQLENLKPQALFSRFINWVRANKKRALMILSGIILIILVVVIGWGLIKNRFFPTSKIPSLLDKPGNQNLLSASMQVKTAKTTYAQTETIPVSVIASSNNEQITGFDTVIEYDSEFLTLSKKNPPALSDFEYFGKNDDQLIRVSAVRKPDGNSVRTFNETELFNIEFTPRKKGKTVLKIIYMPGSISDSNLIDGNSEDVLRVVRGAEIEIN